MENETSLSGFSLSPQQARSWRWQGAHWCRSQCAVLVESSAATVRAQVREAMPRLVAAHEILRTRFVRPAGLKEPLQTVAVSAQPVWTDADWSGDGDWRSRLDALYAQALSAPQQLDASSPLHVWWLGLDDDRAVLLVSASALCMDGAGVLRFAQALLSGAAPDRDETLQYIDIARWLDGLLAPGEGDEGLSYWSRQRALQWEDGLVVATLLEDGEALAEVRDTWSLSPLQSRALSAAPGGATAWLLACWQLLLQRRLRCEDVVIATALDGRSDEQLADAIGPLTRYLPLRTASEQAPSLYGRASALSQALVEASEWQEYFTWPSSRAESAWAPAYGFALTSAPSLSQARWLAHSAHEDRFQLKLGVLFDVDRIDCTLSYEPGRHQRADIVHLLRQFRTLLGASLLQPQAAVAAIPHVDADERTELLWPLPIMASWNTAHALFSEWAQMQPEAVALHAPGGELWSYARLERTSNRLAHYLRAQGVRAEDRIAVCLDRGPDWIVALLGVLKAGAVYVPIDPDFHPQRIAYLLADAGCALTLTDTLHASALGDSPGRCVLLDGDASVIGLCADTAPDWNSDVEQLAYLIYTSGSTGVPKGVGISHRALHSYVLGVNERLALPAHAELLSLATIGADLGHTALFVALCTGRTLRLLPAALALDPEGLADELERAPVDCLKIVPTHLQALLSAERLQRVLPRACLVLGGSALEPELVARIRALAPRCRIINHYGPTETTVGICTYELAGGERPGVLPIGSALAHGSAYVLNEDGDLSGIGVPGELYLGGESLARGYWHRPDLTAERFVPDPYGAPGSRLYRTGDLCVRWADGKIVYQGRLDHQVKIRGYRVELGEIESVLCTHPAVESAVAVLAAGERLCAYVVPVAGAAPKPEQLRAWLSERLPEYMLPTAWQMLKALPLTRNGKVDRGALPAIDTRGGSRAYRAPTNTVEAQLVEVWQQVLGVAQVGVDDNFFELGGDSIIAIQIAARVNRLGFALQPKRIFQAQAIADIAKGLEPATSAESPTHAPADGRIALLPSQARFFELHPDGLDHYNQAVYLRCSAALRWAGLRAALAAVYARHDGLNSRFARDEQGRWWQDIGTEPLPPSPLLVDLSALPTGRREAAREAVAAAAQASLSASGGILSRLLVFSEAEQPSPVRLLWLFHHLLVDGVSWRILLEDINDAYAQACAGQTPALGEKSSPLASWSQAVARYAHAALARGELEWWESVAGPRTAQRDRRARGDIVTASIELDAAATENLLKTLPRAFNTEVNDALLTALALAFQRWNGNDRLLVELEGHGREAIDPALDTTSTVGWFTSRYPVRLPSTTATAPARLLAEVKETLRATPQRGIGYGALRYSSGDPQAHARMRALAEAEVSFNYLGQFGRGAEYANAAFHVVPEKVAHLHGSNARHTQPLAVTATVADGRMALQISADAGYCDRAEAERLGELLLHALRELVQIAVTGAQPGCTPSDYPGCELDQDGLERVLDAYGGHRQIEAIHPVSPLQHGMLFETLLRPGTGVNMLQLDLAVDGELDPAAMRQAWNDVATRHPIFRTVFHGLDSEHPRQLVMADAAVTWVERDLREFDEQERARRGDALMESDRAANVELNRQVASRVLLLRLGEDAHRMIWTRHHALVDGWSSAIVLRELMQAYAHRCRGEEPVLPAARAYGSFIQWMRRRQRAGGAERYWREYLSDVSQPTRAGARADWHRSLSHDTAAEYQTTMPADVAEAVRAFARREQITIGCIYQAAWGLALAERERRDDVVYGTVASGRPAELDGVETIVGPLINTLPLRLQPPRGQASAPWLREIQARLLEHESNSHLPLAQIQKQSGVGGSEPLFASLLVVQNFITEAQRRDIERDRQRLGVELRPAPTAYKISYPLTAFVTLGDEHSLRLCSDPGQFDAAAIAAIAADVLNALQGLVQGEVPAALAREADESAHAKRLHHIGVACTDIAAGVAFVRSQFRIEALGETVYDPLQDANLCLIQVEGGMRIELVSGPQVAGLLARGITLYHTCYEVDDLGAALADALANGGTLVAEPKPAVLFDHRRVAFVQTPIGLVELLERRAAASATEARFDSDAPAPAEAASPPPRQLVVAGTFTVAPMHEALVHFAQWSGLPARVEMAPYAQLFQQLVDPGSAMRRNAQGANLLVVRLEDWLGSSASPDAAALERNVAQFREALAAAAANSAVPYFLLIAPSSPRLMSDADLAQACNREQRSLIELAARCPGVHLIEGDNVVESFGLCDWFDADSERLAHLPYSADAMTALAVGAIRAWHATQRAPVKVVVVDCDQTLWGGVCAEVGATGVSLSPPRLALQDLLRSMQEAGVLLCLCSRNVESDVMAVFDGRSDMRLKREHLTAWRINWLPKSDNLRELAAELGLGLDSFVFIDDDPVQCAQMRNACPQVLTLEVPEDETAIMPLLRQVWALDVQRGGDESRARGQMYRENRLRAIAASEAPSLADFIASLELDISIGAVGESERARVAELTVRTNQFNLNGRRRTEAELDRELRGGGLDGFCVRLRDRFGDYGLVGTILYRHAGDTLQTDTFLLSCRALGRGVEHAMLRELGRRALTSGCRTVELALVASERNAPVRDFLAEAFGGDGAADMCYRVPAGVAAALEWAIERKSDLAAEAGARTGADPVSAASAGAIGSSSQVPPAAQRVPYEAIAHALLDLSGVTTALQLAALPAGRKLRPYVPARSPIERTLCTLYGELLGIGRVGVKDHFFELGGHSLLATRLVAACQREFGVDLPLARIFEVPVVEDFANVLQALQWTRLSDQHADGAFDEAMDEGVV